MWCFGSDGCGLFIMAEWQVYCVILYTAKYPRDVQNPKCQRHQHCLVRHERAWMCAVLWEMLSSWLHQCRQLLCVIRLSVCLNWFSSSIVQVGQNMSHTHTHTRFTSTSVFPPFRVWVWSMIGKNNKRKQAFHLGRHPSVESQEERPDLVTPNGLSLLLCLQIDLSVLMHPTNAASQNGKINTLFQ